MYDESNDKQHAAACTVRYGRFFHSRVVSGVRFVLWCAVLVVVNFPATASSQAECPGIHIDILDIRNSTGTIGCALFESPVGFPDEFLRLATHIIVLKIRDTQASCDFVDIPPGTYALAVIHDENMNGKLDKNWLGIPKEGYGFSSDAKASLSPPSFSEAGFLYQGQDMALSISLHY